jgi:hypothetical protein
LPQRERQGQSSADAASSRAADAAHECSTAAACVHGVGSDASTWSLGAFIQPFVCMTPGNGHLTVQRLLGLAQQGCLAHG